MTLLKQTGPKYSEPLKTVEPLHLVQIVDDDPGIRRALARLLKSVDIPAQCFAGAKEFIDAYDPSRPGCAIFDVSMPEMTGLELQEVMAERGYACPIIFLTGQSSIPDSVRAMKNGAVDFLTKPVDDEKLINAVRLALDTDRRTRLKNMGLNSIKERLGSLTPREMEVLTHVVTGQLNKQIAADLGTVEKTIKVHRGRVMRKMGVRTVVELVHTVDLVSNPAEHQDPA